MASRAYRVREECERCGTHALLTLWRVGTDRYHLCENCRGAVLRNGGDLR